MGEGPALHASGFHHPALAENANQYKAAQSLLLSYFLGILTQICKKCKVFPEDSQRKSLPKQAFCE